MQRVYYAEVVVLLRLHLFEHTQIGVLCIGVLCKGGSTVVTTANQCLATLTACVRLCAHAC
jgi:hypothetical protein